MKLKKLLSESMSGLPIMKVISNPFAKAFSVVNEQEDDKYVHIGYGKYREKGKEDDKSAPTFTKDDGGKYIPTKGGDTTSTSDKGGETKPNMFAKGYDAPDLDKGKEEPSQPKRQGNPQVNKAVEAKAKELGITPQKLGKEEYQKNMAQAAVAALTDANFHSEARDLISKLEGKPEWSERPKAPSIDSPEYDEWRKSSVYSSEYYDASGKVEQLGIGAAEEAGWSGNDVADSIAHTLRKNGFNDLADKIQSVIKENKSTKLKTLIKK